jgi:hypothetical protein
MGDTMDSGHTTQDVVVFLRISYPIILLITFIVAFITNSIITAKKATQNDRKEQMGPGGRPLPKRARSTMAVAKSRKLSRGTSVLFRWLAVGVLATLVADAAINMTHVLFARSQHWWCGQSVVVGPLNMEVP